MKRPRSNSIDNLIQAPTGYSGLELAKMSELDLEQFKDRLAVIKSKKAFICDMDGVIYHGNKLLPGAKEFVGWLQKENKQFLFLTNNSAVTPQELTEKMHRLGLEISKDHFYTSAISTAKFLKSQKPHGGSCYVIGEPGLTYALYEHGFTMSSDSPDYVVIGEGNSHNYEKLTKALNLVCNGAKLIGTNPDTNGVTEGGMVLGCGTFLAAIELASGKKCFTCGKPSALMMQYALHHLKDVQKEDVAIIGDRMDTDILAGIYSGIDPILVMSGVTTMENLFDDAYRPFVVLNGVGEVCGGVTVTNASVSEPPLKK